MQCFTDKVEELCIMMLDVYNDIFPERTAFKLT